MTRSRPTSTSVIGAVKRSHWASRLVRHNPAAQWPLTRLVRRYEARPDERDEIRREVVERALGWAAATPYGRSVSVADPARLEEWPILQKEVVKADETRFVAGRRLPAVAASTGGTTGVPLMLRRSFLSLNAEQFFLDRVIAAAGVSFATSRFAVLRGDDVKDPSDTEAPYGHVDQGGRRLVLSSVHLGAGSLPWYADELRSFEPDFLWAYPSTMSSLVRLLDEAGIELSIPLVVTSSEMLYPAESRLAEKRLGARIVDYYGQAERVALAHDSGGGGYRFDPLYGTVELRRVDQGDDAGLATAEIIGTGHWNSAMPLVRYATGDAIRYRPSGRADQLERVARGDEAFDGLLGRHDENLTAPDGRVLVGINQLPRGLDGVLRMQVRHEAPTEVRVLLVTAGGLTGTDRATLEANCRRKLPSSMRIVIEEVDELPRNANGKVPFVVRADGLTS